MSIIESFSNSVKSDSHAKIRGLLAKKAKVLKKCKILLNLDFSSFLPLFFCLARQNTMDQKVYEFYVHFWNFHHFL